LKESVESSTNGCTFCEEFGRKTPQSPNQYKYHSVFQTFPHHLLAKESYILRKIIEETTNPSFFRRSKVTPQSILNAKVESWTTCKVTNTVSSSIFDDNIDEDGLSAQSVYEINIGRLQLPKCPVS
jgi:hypothetical protein